MSGGVAAEGGAARPRVVLVTTSFPLVPGATSGTFVERLASALAAFVEVCVVVPAGEVSAAAAAAADVAMPDDPPPGDAPPYRVRAVRYAPRRWRRLAHRPGGLPAALARRDPALLLLPALAGGLLAAAVAAGRRADLLHGQWAIGGVVAGAAGRLLGRPVVTTLRGSDVTRAERSRLDRRLLALCLRWSDAVVAVSPALAERVRMLLPGAGGAVEVIANGLDDAFWSVPPPAAAPGRLRLLGVGNLVAHKDVETAVRAVAALPAAVELTWLGDGPLRGPLTELAAALGAGGRVRFRGAVPPAAVPAALAESDAFLFTSRGEGRPNALLEALAAGRPAVAPEVPGVAELAAPERGVLPYAAGDVEGLRRALARLLDDEPLRRRLAAAARPAAAALAGPWSETARRYDDLYRRLLAGRRRSAAPRKTVGEPERGAPERGPAGDGASARAAAAAARPFPMSDPSASPAPPAPPAPSAESGPRFAFGRNWRSFLRALDDDRVARAEASLLAMLGVADLAGRSFLDVGSGSGLFSLAARRLGARVVSFDYDPDSVACTAALRQRFFPGDPAWTVARGSVLDAGWVAGLGGFDVVYSWGVLHHTGDLWRALDHAAGRVAPGGLLFVALYNDQGVASRLWRAVKRLYVAGPLGRAAVLAAFVPAFFLFGLAQDLARRRDPRRRYREYRRERGMSVLHDWIDWLGGYPFEVTAPGPVIERLGRQGFTLRRLERARGLGNHQFVFQRSAG